MMRKAQSLLGSIKPSIRRTQPLANFSTLKNRIPPEKTHVVSYLVNSVGLEQKDAVAASKKVHFDSPVRPNAVLDFLRERGFTRPQIADIVTAQPKFLLYDPEKTLLPKIEFFSKLAGNDAVATLSQHPFLLTRSLEHRLSPVCDYLEDLIGPEKLKTLFRRGSWALANFDLKNRVIPNMEHLREVGVLPSSISLSLFNFPEIFFAKPDDFLKVVEEVKGMGFNPQKCVFVMAINARTRKRNLSLWDKCKGAYGEWGWSEEEILMAFRKHPYCMLCSVEKIKMVLKFVTKVLGREARSVAKCPNVILYSMEMRIVPRCSVVNVLALKGLVKSDWRLSTVLGCGEKAFLDRYVTRYSKELPELHDFYLRKKMGAVEALPSCLNV